MKLAILFVVLIFVTNVVHAKLKVMVSIEPLAFLVEQIGGEKVDVSTLIPQGKNPHIYSPSPSQIKALNNSDIFFHINAPFESAIVKKVSRSKSKKIVALDTGINKRKMKEHHHHHHHHDKHDKHDKHEGLDPHIWLSTIITKKLANNITETMALRDSRNAEYFKRNNSRLHGMADKTRLTINNSISFLRGSKIFVFHPAFGYFLEEFGLKQVSIEAEGKSPSPKHIAYLIHKAKEEGVKTIFTSPQYSKKAAKTIARGIGGRVRSFNPLEKNIFPNLLNMANTIKESYR